MRRLDGKTCMVSAAAQGIGKAITAAFLKEGATVIALDMNSATLDDMRDALSAPQALSCRVINVTDDTAIAALAADHGSIDVLVNAVGWVADGSILDDGIAALDRSYQINVRAMAAMIAAFLPDMITRGSGSIINIASVVSTVKAAPGRFAYATSKAAVLGMTKAISRDVIDSGVRCNAISPGTVDSPSLHHRLQSTGNYQAALDGFIARQPMGRLGQPEEIAQIALLLASDEAPYMSGENIIIDGGMSL